jgi:ribosomal protein S18 acetylase RimI-like enzyme
VDSVQIRLAELSDIHCLLPLFESYRAFYGKVADREGSLQFLEARLRNGESTIYLAFVSNKIAGFVQLFKSFSSTRLNELWILNDLYTLREFRNQKVGAALINIAKELVVRSNACGMILETQKSNEIGNHLYPSQGFELMDDVNHYFWNNKNFK